MMMDDMRWEMDQFEKHAPANNNAVLKRPQGTYREISFLLEATSSTTRIRSDGQDGGDESTRTGPCTTGDGELLELLIIGGKWGGALSFTKANIRG